MAIIYHAEVAGLPGGRRARPDPAVRCLGRIRADLRDRGAAGPGRDLLLRVNLPAADAALASAPPETGPGLIMGGKPTPFGMDPVVLDRCAEWLSASGIASGRLRLRGLHAHLASGLEAPALFDSASSVLDFAREWCAR